MNGEDLLIYEQEDKLFHLTELDISFSKTKKRTE